MPPDPFAGPPDTLGGGGVSTARVGLYYSLDGTLNGRPDNALLAAGGGGGFASGPFGRQAYEKTGGGNVLTRNSSPGPAYVSGRVWALAYSLRIDPATAGGRSTTVEAYDGGGNSISIQGITSGDRVRVALQDPSLYDPTFFDLTGTGIMNGAWHHLALSWNRVTGDAHLWMDGAVIASRNQAAASSAVGHFDQFRSQITSDVSAAVAGLFWFNGELTTAQVAALVAGYVPP